MAFAEKFIACMADAGIKLDETTIEDSSYFDDAVKYVKSWFDEQDDKTRGALDAAGQTGEPLAVHLSQNDVAPGVPDLMRDFDNNTGWPISSLLDWCLHCLEAASQDDE